MIKLIKQNNQTYAKIIRAGHQVSGTEFFTEESSEIQFGIINYSKNHKTGAHCHNSSSKKTTQLDEILMVQEGTARVDFYNSKGEYIVSSEIFKGDILIIFKGGHNIIFNEDTKVYAIKKGAYTKDKGKTRIIGANNLELIIEND
jgi:hypothetical protein